MATVDFTSSFVSPELEMGSNGKSFTLRLLTMNCWGLRVISKFRRERMEAIAHEINAYDVVALQEVWSKDDFVRMQDIATGLRYSHMFYSGVIGSGLCIFSKYPIVGSYFHQFMSSGGIFDMHKGDVFAGKGVGMCRVKLDKKCHLSIYTAHTYSRFRESQLFECMQFIHYTRGQDLVVMCGDLNTYPKQIVLKLFTKCLDLQDAFFHGDCNPDSCLECKNCHTCDLKGNVFVKKTSHPKRIDYIFFSPVAACGYAVVNKEYSHVMKERIPNQDYNYSDHVGLQVKLTIEERLPTVKEQLPGDMSFIDNDGKRYVVEEIRDSILRKRNEMRANNPLITIEGIRRWILIHLFKAILCLVLLTLVPSPFTVITNVLWAVLVCYWLRNFAGHVVEIGQLFGIENNYRDICNYLGRYKDAPVGVDFETVKYFSNTNGEHKASLIVN